MDCEIEQNNTVSCMRINQAERSATVVILGDISNKLQQLY